MKESNTPDTPDKAIEKPQEKPQPIPGSIEWWEANARETEHQRRHFGILPLSTIKAQGLEDYKEGDLVPIKVTVVEQKDGLTGVRLRGESETRWIPGDTEVFFILQMGEEANQ